MFKINNVLLIVVLFIVIHFSCKNFLNRNYIKDRCIDFQDRKFPEELKLFLKDLMFIPQQTIDYNKYYSVNDINYNQLKYSIDAFYLCATEVTNKQYRTFCNENGLEYLPDTTVWDKTFYQRNHPYTMFYFRHPSYDNFPVVGVTYDQAIAYCNWLTKKLNEIIVKELGSEAIKCFGEIRLPTTTEWEAAAKSKEKIIYPFGNSLFRVDKKGVIYYRANHGYIKNQFNRIIEGMPEHELFVYTTEVKSYEPNPYGIYDLGGNVNELIAFSYPEYDVYKNFDPKSEKKVMIRGGGWKEIPFFLKISVKRFIERDTTASDIGFRIAMDYKIQL